MKKLVVLFLICCMLMTACGAKNEPAAEAPEQATENIAATEAATEATEDVTAAEDVEEVPATGVTVSPLPVDVDMSALENCMVAVSFDKGDAYVDDTGKMQLAVTVYTFDLYDMIDIANLAIGDVIVIQGQDVLVKSLETIDSGILLINGGAENGGYDLWHENTGVYFEHGHNDAKAYYAIGNATIPVSGDFEFADSSDLEKGEVVYYPGDFLTEEANFEYGFTPYNTTIVIENGEVIHMTRIATP